MDALNSAVGIVSLVLGILAIVASFQLFRMSESGAEKMRDSERMIREHVKELDRVFNLLYADTWSLVRDSYTSMHQQLRVGHVVAESPDQMPFGLAGTSEAKAAEDKGIELQDFLIAAFTKSADLGPVTAEDLVAAAGTAGYASTEALAGLYDLTFVQQRLFIGGSEIRPSSTLYRSRQEAQSAQRIMETRALEDLKPPSRSESKS